jgi:hypothetical protein
MLDAVGSITKNLDGIKKDQRAQSDRYEAISLELGTKIDAIVSRINDAEMILKTLVSERADDIDGGLESIRVRVTKSIFGRLF